MIWESLSLPTTSHL